MLESNQLKVEPDKGRVEHTVNKLRFMQWVFCIQRPVYVCRWWRIKL